MVLDWDMAMLLADLEYLIGEHCCCKMWLDNSLCSFRYPVHYPIRSENYDSVDSIALLRREMGCPIRDEKDGVTFKRTKENLRYLATAGPHPEEFPPEFIGKCITGLFYKFGANHLYIGSGLVDVLTYLEKRYKIDFNKLEEEVKER